MRRYVAMLFFAAFAVAALLPVGCEKAGYADEGGVRLEFSVDTLSFDTLFTTAGSTTRCGPTVKTHC